MNNDIFSQLNSALLNRRRGLVDVGDDDVNEVELSYRKGYNEGWNASLSVFLDDVYVIIKHNFPDSIWSL